MYLFLLLNHFFILCVHGINADGSQDDMMFRIDSGLNAPDQQIQLICGAGIRYFNVDRTVPGIRAVIIQNKIIGSVDLRKARHGLPDGLCKLGIVAFTQNL